MAQLDATLESNFPTMTTTELREWLDEIEAQALDAWTSSELAELRKDRDAVRAEIGRRGAPLPSVRNGPNSCNTH
jgi:hypothetical protein